MKNIFSGLLVVVAMALTGCRSALPLAGPPPDAWYIPKIKVALYLDVGCKGGGVIHWAQLLKSSPDVACDFINAADVPTSGKERANKNDTVDSRKLARELANGSLEPIYVPPPAALRLQLAGTTHH